MGCADPPSKGVGAPHQCSRVNKKTKWMVIDYPTYCAKMHFHSSPSPFAVMHASFTPVEEFHML